MITLSQLAEMQARLARGKVPPPAPLRHGCDREADLHEMILSDCRRLGWLALHGSMAHATKRTAGEPDFVILADDAQVFLVECKTRTGKLTQDQAALHAWAARLGHKVHVVRSREDWEEVKR